MRAILTNFGSTGDVQPFVALAIELRRHGHQPVLALSPGFAAWAELFDLPFVPIGPDVHDALRDVIRARVEMAAFPDSVAALRSFLAPIASIQPQLLHDLRTACRAADVLIGGPTQPAARIVYELTGLPFAAVYVSHPAAVGTPAMQQAQLSFVNPLRAELGLPLLRDALTDYTSPQLTIYAMSRQIVPLAATWPAHCHMPGYFFLDDEGDSPDPALMEFIAAGEPPVVFTFGSVVHADAAALTDLIVAATQRMGRRAIIQHGWSGLAAGALPPQIYACGYVPHHKLFPHAACVVHHGSAGTTSEVFRAGVPSIFIPHNADQPLWAQAGRELGCAGRAIPYAQLTAQRLSQALSTTLADPSYSRAAAAVGERVRREQGLKRARELIEALVASAGGLCADTDEQASAHDAQAKIDRRRAYRQRERARKGALYERGD